MNPPHDLGAERALLGAIIVWPDRVPQVLGVVEAEDFFNPRHGSLWQLLVDMWMATDRMDTLTIIDRMRHAGIDQAEQLVVDLQAATPGAGHVEYAAAVVRCSLARRGLAAAADLAQGLYDVSRDPGAVLEDHRRRVASIDLSRGKHPPSEMVELGQFLERPVAGHSPWAIPGLLRVGWRAVLVASEGLGKSTALRQMALCASQGVHPFALTEIPPIRTLMIDLENPPDAIDHQCSLIMPQLRRTVGEAYDPERCWIWPREVGLNLRNKADRSDLEAAVAHVRPRLVTIGPAYKTYRAGRDSDEQASVEVLAVLDDLRTRYGFALVVEQHAPKKVAGAKREMAPYGSQRWLAWPDFGIRLVPTEGMPNSMNVEHYRGARLPARWPQRLDRGDAYPWLGWWAKPWDGWDGTS